MKAQTIKGLSIGYDTIKDSIENGVRHLKELRLWEVSSDIGLQVEGKLVLEDPQARIALAHLKAGTIKGLSIGFDIIKDAVENGVRHLKELRLWEVSVVTFPMNEAAMVTSVKSIDDARRVLREAAANPDEQAALRSLLKEIRALLDPESDDEDNDDEKEIALALRSMVLELKAMDS